MASLLFKLFAQVDEDIYLCSCDHSGPYYEKDGEVYDHSEVCFNDNEINLIEKDDFGNDTDYYKFIGMQDGSTSNICEEEYFHLLKETATVMYEQGGVDWFIENKIVHFNLSKNFKKFIVVTLKRIVY